MEKTRKNDSTIDRSFGPPEGARRFPVIHITAGLIVVIILAGGFYFARRSGSDPRIYTNDFNVYYHAAREVMAGRDPYEDSLRPSTPYLYPPLLSEVILPLALLPLPVAAYAWYLASAACVMVAAWMAAGLGRTEVQSGCASAQETKPAAQSAHPLSLRALIAAASLLMLIRFVLDNFDFGQVNTIIASLAVAHVYFYSKGKKLASAVALVLAVSIKLTPVILILYHLAKSRLRFAAACAGLLVAVSLLSFLPFGNRAPDVFAVFVNRTVKNGQGFDLAFSGNQSLRGAVARLFEVRDHKPDMYGGESTRSPTSFLTLALSMALAALSILSASRAQSDMSAAAPFFCCAVLLSPLSWKAHFVILILPVAYLIAVSLAAAERRRRYLMAILAAAFALFNITSPRLFGPEWGEWTDAHSLVTCGTLLVYFAAVWQATRRFVNLK